MTLGEVYNAPSSRNVPDAVMLKLMEEQRSICTSHLEAWRQDASARETVKDCHMLGTMWCDTDRCDDTEQGGSGCLGAGITDVRVESRRYKTDANGNKIPGSETEWALCQVLQMGTNINDPRGIISSEHFKLVTADADGSNKKLRTLKDITGNAKALFPMEELEAPKLEVDKVAVAHRMAFVPMPSAESGWSCEVRYVCYGYNTMNDEDPAHAILFGDTMNTSLFTEESGATTGWQPMYTKLLTNLDPATGRSSEETKYGCYATSVEETNRTLKNIGTETAEESAAAASKGKGTQVRTGPITLKGTSSAAWHVAVGLERTRAVPCPPSFWNGNEPEFRSLGAVDESDAGHVYRGGGADDDEDNDDGFDPQYAPSARGGVPVQVEAKEGRIGLGSYVCEAKPLPAKNPIAQKRPAIATSVAIMTVPMGTVPDKETIRQACAELKKRHELTAEIGTHVASRLSAEAVEAGLTTKGPLAEETAEELEKTFGKHGMEKAAPYPKKAKTEVISQGRPCVVGVPIE